jgi:hypothetical protein
VAYPSSSAIFNFYESVARSRPSLFRRARPALIVLLLSTAAWLLVGFVSFAHTLWIGFGDASIAAHISLIEWGPWIVLSPVVMLFAIWLPITEANWKWAIPAHIVASLGVAFAINGITMAIRMPGPRQTIMNLTTPEGPERRPSAPGKAFGVGHRTIRGGAILVGFAPPRDGAPPPGRPPISSLMLFNARLTLPIYWLIVVGVLAWRHHRVALEREGRAVRAEREAVRARLAALQAQMQPHFLFNSLNAIAAFITRRPTAAEDMVCALSTLLRSVLRMSERPEIPLREELEFARGYLAVHSIRFEDALRVSWQIEPKTNEALVPTLLLQPLIENALEHGLRGAAGEIEIRVDARNQRLVLSVTDRVDEKPSANGLAHNGTCLGLRNTHERLQTLFGADYRLDLVELPNGARAEIELPLRSSVA